MDQHKNFAASTVVVAPSPALTGLQLRIAGGDALLFPLPPFNATVATYGQLPTAANAEIVRVTAMTGDLVTMLRAQENSTPRSIVVGDTFAATITAKTLQDLEVLVGPMGLWTAVNYSGLLFTANTGTWTVDPADVTTFAWSIVGKTLFLSVAIANSSIAGLPTELQIRLPAGYASGLSQDLGPFWYYDTSPGGWQLGSALTFIGDTMIRLYKNPGGGTWNVNLNSTHLSFRTALAVQ